MTGSQTGAALIVAHGQPSAPEGPEAAIAEFAEVVASHLPGWRVRGATLAAPGALAAAVAGLGAAPVVYPLFMADGWFTGTHLPRRLAEAGAPGARRTPAFGLDPGLPGLLAAAAREAIAAEAWTETDTTVLLAAHGAPRVRRPRMAAEAAAHAMTARGRFRAVVTGFVDEAPSIADSARALTGPAICLPFFAMRAGHVTSDLPEGLAQGGFAGPLLAPIGTHRGVPAMAARAIAAHARLARAAA